MAYPIIDVSAWPITDQEPGGDDEKFWLKGTVDDVDGQSWLFKQATIKQVPVAEANGGGLRPYRQGEDWVEKVASELAVLMGLPAARIEMAVKDSVPGLISRDTRPHGWSLQGGGVLISEVDPRYAPKTDSDKRVNRVGHNLDNIQLVLENLAPSPGWMPEAGWTAFDEFAGFLLFDVFIANRDRHESNWAVLEDADGKLHLSPSFDHGAALGSGLEDPLRQRILDRNGIPEWCERATAHRFEDSSNVRLIDLAADALGRANATARNYWIDKLLGIARPQWESVLDQVPSLSAASTTFTIEVLGTNQERIRHEF